jgi:hypothetical protein
MDQLQNRIIDEGEPQITNFVICESANFFHVSEKIKKNIGKIVNIIDNKYYVEFPNIDGDVMFWRNEILHWSKNKEDLQITLL